MVPTMRRAVLAFCLLSIGCSSGSGAEGAASATDAGADTSATTDAAASGLRTLDTCETNIADDAPEIFKRYFRCVTITTTADAVVIETQSLPPHGSCYWGAGDPNYAPFDTSRGPEYRQNPNTLRAQTIVLTIPKAPSPKPVTVTASMLDGVPMTDKNEYPMGPAGVALDSVALFNPLAAPGDDIEDEKYTFDGYSAHPSPQGEYHYHTASPGPLEVLRALGAVTTTTPGSAEVELFGVMCDGTFVLGCKELDGSDPAGAVDAQGGHVHDLVDAKGVALEAARYHVHVCPSRTGSRRFTPEIQYYSTCTRR